MLYKPEIKYYMRKADIDKHGQQTVTSVEISNRQLDLIYAALADYKLNLQYNGEDFDTMDDLARAENEVEDLFSTLYEIVKV